MKKYSVCFIMPPLHGGGAEKVFIDILKNFDYEHYDVTLILLSRGGIYEREIPDSVNVKSLDDSCVPFIKFLVNRFTLKIWDRLRMLSMFNHRYDTIVSFLEGEPLLFHEYVRKFGRRNISWVHTDLLQFHWTKRVFKTDRYEIKCYSSMDENIFVSERSLNQFNSLYSIKTPARVVYNLIDLDNIKRRAMEKITIPDKKRFTICTVGRLCVQKRFDRLIKAIKIVKRKYLLDVDLWILGIGELDEELRKLVVDSNLEDNVSFLGFQKNPYPYIKAADMFVSSSDTEGYPLVVCEAICLGKPIVATRATGTTEILRDGSGILVEMDENELANEIYLLASDPQKLAMQTKKAIEGSKVFDVQFRMSNIYAAIKGE